jgi:hypothetical protein
MARNSRARFNTGILPQGDGEFSDTGCHTHEGNNLCLYVNTTQALYYEKERAFRDVLTQKRMWKGETEFSVPMRMQKYAEGLYDKAVEQYNREFRDDERKGEDALPICPGLFEDLLRWMCREFEGYEMESREVA